MTHKAGIECQRTVGCAPEPQAGSAGRRLPRPLPRLPLPLLAFCVLTGVICRFIPGFLGIQLAVAYLVSQAVTIRAGQPTALFRMVSVALLTAGLISCPLIVQADDWNHDGARENRAAAVIVNGTEDALLIGERRWSQPGDLMGLSHYLRPDVKMRLVAKPNFPVIPDNSAAVFLLRPSQRLRHGLPARGYKLLPLDSEQSLWKLVR